MNKFELVSAVALKSGISKKDSEIVIESLFEVIIETNEQGEDVKVINFGTFSVKDRAERTGRNPQTKEEIIIPATKVPFFKAGKEYKNRVK